MSAKRILVQAPHLLTERDLSRLVVGTARLGGWDHRYHTHNSRHSSSGFPDWVFIKRARLLAAATA